MQNNENYSGFDLTMYNLFTLLREMYYTRGETETNFLQKSGGVLSGSLTIQGNLVVNGQSYSIDTENLKVGDYTITLAKDNEQTLTSMVGMVVPKYDGTNYGFFGWDADGYAYVGDLTNYDGTSNITLANNSSLQKIATIDTTNTVVASNGVIYVYDTTSHCFKKPTNDNKYYVIRNGAFVETELFTEQKSKNIDNSLYNLGAFDSVSGNTITRQTGYIKAQGNWQPDNVVGNFYRYYIYIDNNDFNFSSVSEINSTDYEANYAKGRYFENDVRAGISIAKDGVGYYLGFISTVEMTSEQINALNIVIQYKLATPYTDNIIENESILPLDSNMANKIRQKVVDGLNLLPNSTNVTLYHDVYYNLPLEKGTYTISASNYASSRQFLVVGAVSGSSSVSVLANLVNTNGVATFTITEDNYTLQRFYLQNSTTTNIMLVKGTHPYPPFSYNQKEHITNDEATLLKQEEEKCSNLCPTSSKTINIVANQQNAITDVANLPAGTYNIAITTSASVSASFQVKRTDTWAQIADGNFNGNAVFTLSDTTSIVIYYYSGNNYSDVPVNIMINKGSEAKSYQEWNGDIVHKADIEPVLLWENPNPTYTLFANQTVNVKDMSKYKYIVFKFKQDYEYDTKLNVIQKVEYQTGAGFTVSIISQDTTVIYLLSRYTIIKNSTQVEFKDCIRDKTVDNAYITPTAIYGTNVL